MQPISIHNFIWTDDYSFMRELTCKNHPTALYLTKNPFTRSLILVRRPEGTIERTITGECTCSLSDLIVIAEHK